MKESNYIIYAHRGASAYLPENTKIAFKKALELNANGIELDLQKTKDEKIVIFHDDVLDIINKYKTHDNIYITSFLYEALENTRELNKNIKISWLVSKINKENIDKLLKIKGQQICPKAELVSKEDIDLANNNGLGVRLWGIYNEEIMKKVYKFNIEGMTVNFPDKLYKLKNKK